jgi:hypothetical protein
LKRPTSALPLGPRFDALKIIEHAASFEVQSDDGSIVRQFPFDDNASRRAVSGTTKKRALQEARTFAGKGAVLVPRSS